MAVISTRQLLDSGVHFGHQTRRWNPKMKRFIFAERNGIYIIDIQQSLGLIDSAYDFEEYIQEKIDCSGIDFDSEYGQFFAYAKSPERAVEWVKSVEGIYRGGEWSIVI